MDVTTILKLVVGLVPYANSLVSVLAVLQGKTGEPGVLSLIADLTPIATSLIDTITKIHNQTIDTHAAVWAPIRDDWNKTAAQWAVLNP